MIPVLKKCNHCQKIKPQEAFTRYRRMSKHIGMQEYLVSRCKDCIALKRREVYRTEQGRQRIIQANQKWAANNPELSKRRQREAYMRYYYRWFHHPDPKIREIHRNRKRIRDRAHKAAKRAEQKNE